MTNDWRMKTFAPFLVFSILACMLCAQERSLYFNLEEQAHVLGLKRSIIFQLDPYKLNDLISSKDKSLTLSLPFYNKTELQIHLEEIQIFTGEFQVINRSADGDKVINYKKGKHFIGDIKGQDHSIVSLSIYENSISGIIKLGYQTFNFGQINDGSKRHIIYEVKDRIEPMEFKCETIGETDTEIVKETPGFKSMNSCTNATNIYFECDYDMYTNFGSVASTVDYTTSIFTEISLIYAAEDIPILISEIVVWSTVDPYADNSSAIGDFGTILNNSGFNGDLAHLLSNDAGQNGGIAFLDQLCNANPYAYSDIVNSYDPYPTYSWDVQVVAHELGHNFGSPHTHECVWGPYGDEQIDDCGNIPAGGGSCYDPANAIIPSTGGTIMSYCHLESVGINFANGFGYEPGNLIRSKHNACMCSNSTCDTATELIVDGTYTAEPNSGDGASNSNATHADWFYFVPATTGKVDIQSCNQEVDTRVWIHSGTCSNLVFETISDDDCDMGNGNNYASQIIQYELIGGVTYYIEWDDRWSNDEFDWTFQFTETITLDPCDDINLMVTGMLQDSTLHAEIKLESDGVVMNGYEVFFKAGQEIELMSGFEIELGGTLDVIIEDCENN